MRDRRKPDSLRRLPESFHKELEKKSFRNLIMFYKTELLNIKNGCNASDQFNRSTTRKLSKKGFLINIPNSARFGPQIVLTPRAESVLMEILDNEA